MTIEKVIKNGFCVGCGGCKVHSPSEIQISFKKEGFYEASLTKDPSESVSSVCPFSSDANNETVIGGELFESAENHYDERIGFFSSVHTGHIKSKEDRKNSSSGGLTSWFAEKLLQENLIDAVVHVGAQSNGFSYRVSKTIEELKEVKNRKSRYSPVTLDSVWEYLRESSDRILFIGIPCFVKTIRLNQSEGLLKNVRYCFALLCGHMKSSGFGELLSWQLGVDPKNIKYIDFRLKKSGFKASEYFFSVTSVNNEIHEGLNASLLGSNWGLGFFRHKACNFCDDIAGELADITFGDAWLPKYNDDYLGNNILVIRTRKLLQILNKYNDELTIEDANVDTFYETQSGNYGNRRGGIIAQHKNYIGWHPKKRVEICLPYAGNEKKQGIYLQRAELSSLSISAFEIAKKANSLLLFKLIIFPKLLKYNYNNGGFKAAINTFLPTKFEAYLRKYLSH